MISQAFEDHRDAGRRACAVLLAWLMAAMLLAVPVGAAATEPAGRVIFSTGEVTAVNEAGFRRPLTRNDVVYPGETVRTAGRGMVDIRMRDDALIALEPESRFAVERYGVDDGAGEVVLRFLRGTLRTITGSIGKDGRDTYEMRTPVATIGVRGTQYALQFCDAGCARADRPAGLYGRVDDGAIAVTNEAGSEVMARDDYFYVADSDVAPRRLLRPPQGVLGIVPGGDDAAAGGIQPPEGGTDGLVGADEGLADADDGLLDGDDNLVSGDGGLLDTGGTVLQTGGGLLQQGGNLLEAGGGLLDQSGDMLAQGGGLLEVGGGLLDTGGGVLDTGGGLLDQGGGLLGDIGDDLGGSGSLLGGTGPGSGDDDLLDAVLDPNGDEGLLDLDGDGDGLLGLGGDDGLL